MRYFDNVNDVIESIIGKPKLIGGRQSGSHDSLFSGPRRENMTEEQLHLN